MPGKPYTPEQVDEVLKHLADGVPLTYLARMDGMPDADTILLWQKAGDERSERIARARELGEDYRAARAVERAMAAEDPAKGRLAFDAERWWLSKVSPKRYGDKTTIAGDKDNPLALAVQMIERRIVDNASD